MVRTNQRKEKMESFKICTLMKLLLIIFHRIISIMRKLTPNILLKITNFLKEASFSQRSKIKKPRSIQGKCRIKTMRIVKSQLQKILSLKSQRQCPQPRKQILLRAVSPKKIWLFKFSKIEISIPETFIKEPLIMMTYLFWKRKAIK